eukprot:TRINITY_DN20161_c0_g1_i1.p1 TRINITY_DN20161_c0_g1~~TRINITY_DN20161_c0_g1_i1.p1  ORF type:complete len:248 (-),score=7.15 TRINITY_DN20161_c0_g1_i1:318-1061(-)
MAGDDSADAPTEQQPPPKVSTMPPSFSHDSFDVVVGSEVDTDMSPTFDAQDDPICRWELSSQAESTDSTRLHPGLCPRLSARRRYLGFFLSFLVGTILICVSVANMAIWADPRDPEFIAELVTYGVAILLCFAATTYWERPAGQCYKLFEERRWIVLLTFLICVPIPPIVSMQKRTNWHWRDAVLVLATLLQLFSLYWYALSYIPLGRRAASAAFKRCCGCRSLCCWKPNRNRECSNFGIAMQTCHA